jgi:hypothetical protein
MRDERVERRERRGAGECVDRGLKVLQGPMEKRQDLEQAGVRRVRAGRPLQEWDGLVFEPAVEGGKARLDNARSVVRTRLP